MRNLTFATYNGRIAIVRIREGDVYRYGSESVSIAIGCFDNFELALMDNPKMGYALGKTLGLRYE